ncbi:MAG: hypothetical protein U1F36_02935 [Planctomycetota bacterium]
MTDPSPQVEQDRDPTSHALSLLEGFRSRVLPGVLRRMSVWKRLEASGQQEVAADAMQELALDCLAHPQEVLALPERDRHTRWIRIVQRVHYAMRERSARKSAGEDALDAIVIESHLSPDIPLDEPDRELLRRMLDGADHLKNGRMSLRATARGLGVSTNALTALRARVAEALGHDDERETYWRGRLAEALCSMAAAWLRDDGVLNLWDDASRRGFEPERCRTRLARIKEALALRPPAPETRQALELVLAPTDELPIALDPRELLRIATRLAPRDAGIVLWRFEAEIVASDLRAAARSLRRARRLRADAVPVTLARARLLEARGKLDAARALLARALARRRGEPRLVASLDACSAPRRYAPSTAAIASSRSAASSG